MKSSLGLMIAAVVIVLCLFILSSTGRKAPLIPQDAAHQGISSQEGCIACHAPGRSSPLNEKHPPKEQCLVCHAFGTG
jgi:hypothetical protein